MIFNKFFIILSLVIINFFIIYGVTKNFLLFQAICVSIISLTFSWIVSNKMYEYIFSSRILAKNRAVLITGCDTGFGHQLAVEIDKLGYHVFAGVLFADGIGAKNLQSLCSDRLKVLKMDVTKFDDISNVMNEIKISNLQLWAVVNNAGIVINTPVEWGYDVNDLSKVFEVNVFGAVRVAKLSIPLLRHSKGRIINVASVAGRISVPGLSSYCMSKHAIKSFSDTLRRELNHFNIKVITIEPSLYRTPIVDWNTMKNNIDNAWDQTSNEVQCAYDEKWRKKFNKTTQLILKFSRKQTEDVVNAMVNGISLEEPKIYYKCGGPMDYISIFLFCYFPELFQDFVFGLVMQNNFVIHWLNKFSTNLKSA